MQHLGKELHSLTYFQEVKNEHYEKDPFFFAHRRQGKECAPIIIASAVDSYLGTMQKHQKLASCVYTQQVILRTHPRAIFLVYCLI